MTSAAIFASRSSFSRRVFVSSIMVSIFALASLTICPTFGRSSGATSFIPFSKEVSCPFLPRKFTLTSDCSIFSEASSRIACNVSLILLLMAVLLFYLFGADARQRVKYALRIKIGPVDQLLICSAKKAPSFQFPGGTRQLSHNLAVPP